MTAIGRLRHRMTLQQKSQVSDSSGGFTTSWSNVGTVWGRLSPKSGYEQPRGDTLQGNATHTLVVRTAAVSTINSTMRFTYGGNTYNINGIPLADERERFTTINLIQGTPS